MAKIHGTNVTVAVAPDFQLTDEEIEAFKDKWESQFRGQPYVDLTYYSKRARFLRWLWEAVSIASLRQIVGWIGDRIPYHSAAESPRGCS